MVQRQSSSATCTKELNPNELNRLLINFKILLLLVQTAFTVHIWQSIGALVDSNNEDVPTLQKMQMVHYAMGFTTFTTRWIHLLNSGWVEKLGKHCSALLWGTTRALASSGGSTSGTSLKVWVDSTTLRPQTRIGMDRNWVLETSLWPCVYHFRHEVDMMFSKMIVERITASGRGPSE